MRIEVLPLYGDNYIYLIHDGRSAAVIDPPAAPPVLKALRNLHLALRTIVITHHHGDHIAGCARLKKETESEIVGPGDSRIMLLDRSLQDGDLIEIGTARLTALATPGHTRSHMAYYSEELQSVWTGDAMFVAGCGRIFEGSAAEMHASLQRIAALPPATSIYCGHDYTQENLEFALHCEPDNEHVRQKLATVTLLAKQRKPTVPSTVEEELNTNPFMRCKHAGLRNTLNITEATDIEVFTELRQQKDRW